MTLKRPEEFDFLDPALQKCPFEFYQSLREYAPVYREPKTGYWIVSRYDDIEQKLLERVEREIDSVEAAGVAE